MRAVGWFLDALLRVPHEIRNCKCFLVFSCEVSIVKPSSLGLHVQHASIYTIFNLRWCFISAVQVAFAVGFTLLVLSCNGHMGIHWQITNLVTTYRSLTADLTCSFLCARQAVKTRGSFKSGRHCCVFRMFVQLDDIALFLASLCTRCTLLDLHKIMMTISPRNRRTPTGPTRKLQHPAMMVNLGTKHKMKSLKS